MNSCYYLMLCTGNNNNQETLLSSHQWSLAKVQLAFGLFPCISSWTIAIHQPSIINYSVKSIYIAMHINKSLKNYHVLKYKHQQILIMLTV